MKKVTLEVIYKVEVEIDESHNIVNEYEGENDLLVDCASYHFSNILPVIKEKGVVIKDMTLTSLT